MAANGGQSFREMKIAQRCKAPLYRSRILTNEFTIAEPTLLIKSSDLVLKRHILPDSRVAC